MNHTQQQAMQIAARYEENRTGKKTKDVSKDKKAVGYDLESKDRKIEVKGFSGRNPFFQLNQWNVQALTNPEFYLYLIFDVKKTPKIIVFDKDKLLEKMNHAKVYFMHELPMRKTDWDSGKEII
jgi:hypothetical protein